MITIATKNHDKVERVLKRYRHICKMLVIDKMLVENLSYLEAISYSKDKTQATNRFYSSVEDAVIGKEDLMVRIKENESFKERVEISLQYLNPEEMSVIKMFYFDEVSRYYIADKLHCSERRCYLIREKALEKLELFLLNMSFGQQKNDTDRMTNVS